MLQRLRSRLHGEGGFTLIELLVVILIIGILAAIAIPSFLNQKGKGQDAATKSNARTAQTAIETYYTDNTSYATDAAGLRVIEPALPSSGISVATSAGAGTTGGTNNYRVGAVANGRTYYITKTAAGAVSRTCAVTSRSDAGSCTLDADPALTGTW